MQVVGHYPVGGAVEQVGEGAGQDHGQRESRGRGGRGGSPPSEDCKRDDDQSGDADHDSGREVGAEAERHPGIERQTQLDGPEVHSSSVG